MKVRKLFTAMAAVLLGVVTVVPLLQVTSMSFVWADEPGETCLDIAPVATAWVDSSKADQEKCNADRLHIRVKKGHSDDIELRRSYLKFDIPESVESVTFYINAEGAGHPGTLGVYTTSWNGDCINWDNAPAPGSLIDSKYVDWDGPVGFDVTSAVTGGESLSLVLKMTNESLGVGENEKHVDFTWLCIADDDDSDGDGIPDNVECPDPSDCPDTDSDGTPDYQDTDSDDDGIPDADEGTGDSDGDGTPDYQDPDESDGSAPPGTYDITITVGGRTLNVRVHVAGYKITIISWQIW